MSSKVCGLKKRESFLAEDHVAMKTARHFAIKSVKAFILKIFNNFFAKKSL